MDAQKRGYVSARSDLVIAMAVTAA
jgi:hypothetical protein